MTIHLRAGPSLLVASACSRSPSPIGPAASARQSSAAVGQQRQRAVDLVRRVVERAAEVELLVVERAGREAGVGAGLAAADEHDAAAGRARLDRGAPCVGPADGLEHDVVIGQHLPAHRARRLGLGAALGVAVGEGDGAPLGDEQGREHLAHRAAAEHAHVGRDLFRGRARDGVDGGGERLGHRGRGGLEPVGDRVERCLRRRHLLGEAAEHPLRLAADLRPPGGAGAAGPARHRVADQHALAGVLAHAAHLVPEGRRARRQQRMAAAPHLHVGPAGGGRLDPDHDLARPRDRVGDLEHAQVLVAEQQGGPHESPGRFAALTASPRLSARGPRVARPARRPSRRAGSGR